MKTSFIIASLLISSFAQANADVFSKYQDLATTLAGDFTSGAQNTERTQTELSQLVAWGYEIMDLYDNKFSECSAQYLQVAAENEQMKASTYAQLEERYHDGIGLEAAPKHCYLARSMVIHPYMVMAIFREKIEGAAEEIEEVASRAAKIRSLLGL